MADMILTPTDASLTADELQQAVEILGLRLFRFDNSAQAPHQLSLRLQGFVNGQLDQTFSDLVLGQRDGEQRRCLYSSQRA